MNHNMWNIAILSMRSGHQAQWDPEEQKAITEIKGDRFQDVFFKTPGMGKTC